ncbi:hypothetical protein [Photorhabdus australis]|uniref:hypothetical protein n=1 Tax=Photorhabdus australis TaxID=286156 RepID=UPI0030DBC0BD
MIVRMGENNGICRALCSSVVSAMALTLCYEHYVGVFMARTPQDCPDSGNP